MQHPTPKKQRWFTRTLTFASRRFAYYPLIMRQSLSVFNIPIRFTQQRPKTTHKLMSGFTLIELLLYLSIAAIVIFAVVVVLRMSQEAKVKSSVIGAVERNGAFLADDINHSVRGSAGVSSPGTIGASGAELIYYELGSQEETRVYLEGGVVYSQKKNTFPIALSDKTVTVENLLFTRMASLGNGIHIMYSFSAKGSSPSSAYEYSYQKKFSGGASIQIN